VESYRWSPSVETGDGKLYPITAVSSDECPRSAITPESAYMAELLFRARAIKEAAGVPLFGSDSSSWPAWWADALQEMQTQIALDMEAYQRFVKSQSR